MRSTSSPSPDPSAGRRPACTAWPITKAAPPASASHWKSALLNEADHVIVKGIILVLGNALIIVLEAMVVSIQTTRLVLFEFFTRFLTGAGRVFSPLPPPPAISLEA